MKNFIKHVSKSPKLLAWYIGVFIFFTAVVVTGIRDWEGILDNPIWLVIILGIMLPLIFTVACYHPYYEWKTGIEKEKQIQAYKDSLNK